MNNLAFPTVLKFIPNYEFFQLRVYNFITSIFNRKNLANHKFTFFIRFFSLLFVFLYVKFLFDVSFPWYAYTFKRFVAFFIISMGYGVLGNLGLFFITTKWAKRWKILATILYVPSIFITPVVVGAFLSYFIRIIISIFMRSLTWESWLPYSISIIIVFLSSLLVYRYFNPWKANG